MWRNKDTNEEEVDLKQVIKEITDGVGLRGYATSVGEKASYASYISQVSNVQKPPSDELLDRLGLERRIIYVKKTRRWK